MNPQPYNRLFKLTGTKGYATKYPQPKFALDSKQLQESGVSPKIDNLSSHGFLPDAEAKKLEEKYEHPHYQENMAKLVEKWAMVVWTS